MKPNVCTIFLGKHPELKKLMHSLDVWHKAKSLAKQLHKAAKGKDCEGLKEWIPCIVNHFWYSCQVANGDVKKLKDCWFGTVHHVCGEHKWSSSECMHGPLVTKEPKTFLCKTSKAAAALRSVVFDKKFLANFEHYVTFRHTGNVENFNSMLTKYAPKRVPFEYIYFIARMALAALDHNLHLYRPLAISREGNKLFKKHNRRTKAYHAEPVKSAKQHEYMPCLLSRVLKARQERTATVLERNIRRHDDPKRIAPIVDPNVQPPAMDFLVKERFSRLKKEN